MKSPAPQQKIFIVFLENTRDALIEFSVFLAYYREPVMKKILCLLLLLPGIILAGVLEDMEEALIRRDGQAAIALVNRGMDINTVDASGNTLMIQAIQRDVPELFDFLMKKRARFNTRNKYGESALSIAAYTGRIYYVKPLVEAGAEINFFGWPPLAYAAFNGHLEIAKYLLEHGAQINATVPNGSSALFLAARNGHEDLIKLLLDKGADPNIINENNESAIDWALKSKNTDIADLIRHAGGRAGKSVTIEISK